jgi:hypothetical protein
LHIYKEYCRGEGEEGLVKQLISRNCFTSTVHSDITPVRTVITHLTGCSSFKGSKGLYEVLVFERGNVRNTTQEFPTEQVGLQNTVYQSGSSDNQLSS